MGVFGRDLLGCTGGKTPQIAQEMGANLANHPNKRKDLNEYVIHVMTYGNEIWALTIAQMGALQVAQRRMERKTQGITLRDRKHNTWSDSRQTKHRGQESQI